MNAKRRILLTLTLALVCAWTIPATAANGVVVLVRHAEKVDASRDPDLSDAGKKRAQTLADMLADMNLEAIYSSDFTRTRDTARPLADRLGLELTLYDAGNLDTLAVRLRESGQRVLVVGHSNTTPALVELLGGEPGAPIEEDEYDRLYIVVPGGDEAATALLRYGN